MSRSLWKLPYISLTFFQNRFLKRNDLNVRLRNSFIPAIFVLNKVKLHVFNGIWYLSVIISTGMLGFKFGEFSFTKRSDRQTHLKKKRKKKSSTTKK